MARTKKPVARVRLNLALTEATHARLQKMQVDTNAESLSEVIRHSLWLLDQYMAARKSGGRLMVEEDGKPCELRLPI